MGSEISEITIGTYTIMETESQKKALVKIMKPFYGSTTISLQAEPEHEQKQRRKEKTNKTSSLFFKFGAQSWSKNGTKTGTKICPKLGPPKGFLLCPLKLTKMWPQKWGHTLGQNQFQSVTKNSSSAGGWNLFSMGHLYNSNVQSRKKKQLFVNIDETSVAFVYPGQKGNAAQE